MSIEIHNSPLRHKPSRTRQLRASRAAAGKIANFFSRRPSATLWLASAAIVVSILLLFSIELRGRYLTAIADAERTSQGFAEVLAEHTSRTFEAIERTLQVAATIGDATRADSSPASVNEALRNLQRSTPALLAIGVSNERGDVTAHSYNGQPVRPNIADLQHFIAQRDTPMHGFYISPLYRSAAASHRWISSVSIRLTNLDGSFGGVVSAPLDLSYFARIYQSVRLGPNDTVTLLLRDGTVLTREPFFESAVGKSYEGADLFTTFIGRAGTGVFQSVSPIDDRARIAGYSIVAGLPLVMVVTQDRADVLSQWYDHIRSFGPMVAALIVIVIFGTVMLVRRTKETMRGAMLLEATLDNMHNGLMVVDSHERIAIYNRKALQLLDLPESLLASHPASSEVIAYQTERGEFATASDAIKHRLLPRVTGETEHVYERTRPNGTVLEIRTVPFAEGGVVRTYKDITDWKQIERELSEREKQFRLLAENATDIIARLNFDGTMLYISPSCSSIIGYTVEDMIGVRITDYIFPDDVKPTVKLFAEIAKGRKCGTSRIEYRFRHKDGHWIWLEANPRLVFDELGHPLEFVDVVRETTERKRIECDAIEARCQAERAAEAQGQFLATMSHELRTPLNSIVGFSDIILSRGDLAPDVRRQIRLIQTASDTLLTVVNDVLDYSKIEEGKLELAPTVFDVRALIQDVMDIIRGSATSKNIDLRLDVDDDIARHLLGDDQRIRQILFNLLNNAIKFTPRGQVSLLVKLVGRDSDGDHVRFDVTDTGIGIASNKLPKLFQRFSQVDSSTSRDYGGSGLGLAISKRLVEIMDGRIGVDSSLGQGSRFWFELKLPSRDIDGLRAATHGPDSVPAVGSHVLLVEDVDANREIARTILTGMGYRVDTASDGAEAIAAVEVGGYDIVLMDIQMPGIDGITATERIRALPGNVSSIPIVAMTANVLSKQIKSFQLAGMNGHIGKPFKRHDLKAVIETCLAETAAKSGIPAIAAPAMATMDHESIKFLSDILGEEKVDALLTDLRTQLERFAAASLSSPSSHDLSTQAHMLVSTAGMLGFPKVSDYCARLERALSGDADSDVTLDDVRVVCLVALDEISRRMAFRIAAPAPVAQTLH